MKHFYELLETHLPTKIHLWSLLQVVLRSRPGTWRCMGMAVVATVAPHLQCSRQAGRHWQVGGNLMIINFVINSLWFLTPHSRVEVRAGSQIATMPLHRLLFILRLSSC